MTKDPVTEAGVVRVGSRSSALAVRQTDEAIRALAALYPSLEFRVRPYVTYGDRRSDRPLHELEGTGVFTGELEAALRAGEIDLAVHSLKDMACNLPDGLALGALLERADPRDAILSSAGHTLAALPHGARLGTSSLRRRAQLRRYRPDLDIVDIRGNVDTRIAKMDSGQCDALALAAAGVLRLGRGMLITDYIPPDVCLPAPGQGAIAVEARSDDTATLARLARIDHRETRAAVTAERAFLRGLGAGCQAPVGAQATLDGAGLELRGVVLDPSGGSFVQGTVDGPGDEAEELGLTLARRLLAAGAGEIIEACRDGAGDAQRSGDA